MPNWVTSHGNKIYSISRTAYPDGRFSSGGVHSFQHDGTRLTAISHTSSHGKGGCHLSVSPDGKALVASNIAGSTISVYPLAEDGSIGEPTYVFDYNKSDPDFPAAHPHQTSFDSSGRLMITSLRTMDCLDIYSYESPQDIKKIQRIALPKVVGPRHFAIRSINPSKAFLYVLSEKDNSIRVFSLDTKDLDSQITVDLKQAISTMGKDLPLTPPDFKDLASEIAFSDDGKFLYASNRGFQSLENDTITVFSIDDGSAEHHLTHVDTQRSYGKHPRMFALSRDKDNQWVAVANQFSQDLVIFERDSRTGRLGKVRGKMDVRTAETRQASPDKVKFVQKMNLEGVVTIRDCLKGRLEGPMCVSWK
ncbi:hypothetical protein CLAIMM_12396 [Cladophialophora immunda]|nr:hypothetical protein CLAIMM_12396 [Cladophialophora immunda]